MGHFLGRVGELMRGKVAKNKKSPDFRSPEVGISVFVLRL